MKRLVSKRMVIATMGLIVPGVALQLSFGQKIGNFAVQYMEGTDNRNRGPFRPLW